jgi:hypothetical protein
MLNLMRSYPLDTVRRVGIRPLPSAVSGVSHGIGTNIGVDIDFLLFARPGNASPRNDTQHCETCNGGPVYNFGILAMRFLRAALFL